MRRLASLSIMFAALANAGCFGDSTCEQRLPTYEACMQGVREIQDADGIRRILFGARTGQQSPSPAPSGGE